MPVIKNSLHDNFTNYSVRITKLINSNFIIICSYITTLFVHNMIFVLHDNKKVHLFANASQVLFVLDRQASIQLRGIHLLRDVFYSWKVLSILKKTE